MKMTGKLRALEDGGTEVTSVSEVNVVGILAQMGSRVITEVSNIMFGRIHQELSGPVCNSPRMHLRARPNRSAPLPWPGRRQRECFTAIPEASLDSD